MPLNGEINGFRPVRDHETVFRGITRALLIMASKTAFKEEQKKISFTVYNIEMYFAFMDQHNVVRQS